MQNLTYARHSLALNSEDSSACNYYCEKDVYDIMICMCFFASVVTRHTQIKFVVFSILCEPVDKSFSTVKNLLSCMCLPFSPVFVLESSFQNFIRLQLLWLYINVYLCLWILTSSIICLYSRHVQNMDLIFLFQMN